MNGLEAIDLMKQGKIVKANCIGGSFLFKIENGIVKYKPCIGDWEYKEAEHFCLSNEYEEYIETKVLTGWERLKDGGEYCYISYCEEVLSATDYNDEFDYSFYENANYFSTKEKAEEIHFKETLFRKLQRFSDENGGNEIDWSDGTEAKYSILYKHLSNDLCIDVVWNDQHSGIVYFSSTDIANKAIELFHDDLIKYFTHDWSKGE